MSNLPPVTHMVDAEGIGWISFGAPDDRANIFNVETCGALRVAITALAEQPLRAVIVQSNSKKIFVAGADVKELVQMTDSQRATQFARDGQAMLGALASLKVPVVCAIHGACAGGGFELALACHWRLASDAPVTMIGLAEVSFGLIPGWGGTARLARLIGVPAAVEHMHKAELVPAVDAYALGLVDELVGADELSARAKAAALRLAAEGLPRRPELSAPPADFFTQQRKLALARYRDRPALLAVLDVVEKGLDLPLATALELEAALFGHEVTGKIAQNLLQVFLLKAAGRKATTDAWFPAGPAAEPGRPSRTIGIVGASDLGVRLMSECVLHGYGVIICDPSKDELARSVTTVRGFWAELVDAGQLTSEAAHKLTGAIGITTKLEDFDLCDLVIEAIPENMAAKQRLFTELAKFTRPDCVWATTTAIFPLEDLARSAPQLLGLHFSLAPGQGSLVELALGQATTRAAADRALAFIKTLGKTPVLGRSSPGGFVLRPLFFYLQAAGQLWQQGVSTEAIDGAMQEWGWPQGPLQLIDEWGVAMVDRMMGQLSDYFPERLIVPTLGSRMMAAGLTGRPAGGFYIYSDGVALPNPAMATFAPSRPVSREASAIVAQLNGVLLAEIQRMLAEGVLKTAAEADLAFLLGAAFPAFRGGPMRAQSLPVAGCAAAP